MNDNKLLFLINILGITFLCMLNYFVVPKVAEAQENVEKGETLERWEILYAIPVGSSMHAVPFGIKDPDGNKAVWVTSSNSAKDMSNMLSSYPVETIGGVPFYEISSWEDASYAFRASYENQGEMILNLFNEVSTLKSRVISLENQLRELMKEKNN